MLIFWGVSQKSGNRNASNWKLTLIKSCWCFSSGVGRPCLTFHLTSAAPEHPEWALCIFPCGSPSWPSACALSDRPVSDCLEGDCGIHPHFAVLLLLPLVQHLFLAAPIPSLSPARLSWYLPPIQWPSLSPLQTPSRSQHWISDPQCLHLTGLILSVVIQGK